MRRTVRHLQRGLIGLLLLASILLGVSWAGFPLLAPPIARALLATHDVDASTIDVRRPGLSRLRIDRLELRHEEGRVHATGVTLRWRLAPVLRAPLTLTAVDIGHLEVTHTARSLDGAEQPSEGAHPGAPRPSLWFGALGGTALDIARLDFEGTLEDRPLKLDGRLRSAGGQAAFDGTLHAERLDAPVRMTLSMDETEHLGLALDGPDGPLLAFDGRFHDRQVAGRRLALGGDVRLDLGAVGRLLQQPPAWPEGAFAARLDLEIDADGRMAVRLDEDARGSVAIERGDNGDAVSLELALALDTAATVIREADGTLTSSGNLRLGYAARHPAGRTDGHLRLSNLAGTWQAPMLQVEAEGVLDLAEGGTRFDAHARMALADAGRLLHIDRGAFLMLRDARWGERDLGEFRAVTTRRAPIAVDALHAGSLAVPLRIALDLTDPAGLTATAELTLDPAGTLTLDLAHADLPLAPSGLAGRLAGAAWPFRAGRAELTGKLSRTGEGRVTGVLTPRLVGVGLDHAGHRLRDGSGSLTLLYDGDDLELRDLDLSLGRVTVAAPTENPMRFEDVVLGGHGRLHFGIEQQGDGRQVVLQRFSLSPELVIARIGQGALTIDAVELNASVEGTLAHFTAALAGTAVEADFGVPMRSLRCTADLSAGQPIALGDCGGEVLGGSVALVRGHFDPVTGDGYLPLGFSGIDLAAVLALMQDPALGGSGTLDGSVPLRLEGSQPTVSEGWLAARPPGGTLAYATRPSLLASIEQPMVKLALSAVRDLRYEQLESRVDYADDGTLVLTVSLLGSNPDIEDGRPINLNLNVSQNLLGLLESLRVADDIESRLQRVQP